MPRFIAFLRAINVTGRTVKMNHLRQLFESFELVNVETFIASGNVVFETPARNSTTLEKKISAGLRVALGYEVATFVRTDSELHRIAHYPAFDASGLEAAQALNIAFLATPPAPAATHKLLALETEIDDFAVHGREVYWLCRKKQSESTFSNAVLEKTLGQASTLRGISTLQKMAARYTVSKI